MGLLAVIGIVSADTASNTVPPSRLGQSAFTQGPNDWKPSACAGLTLTSVVVGTGVGTLNGTNGANLILGVPGTRTIDGRQGTDCIVGNFDVRTIDGGGSTDVCIGWATTTFTRCETIIRQ